jgi:predicted metal-dependent RNase
LVVLTHGEPNAALTLAGLLQERFHFKVIVPEKNDTIQLVDN